VFEIWKTSVGTVGAFPKRSDHFPRYLVLFAYAVDVLCITCALLETVHSPQLVLDTEHAQNLIKQNVEQDRSCLDLCASR
jgi:hypothetical protein